MPIPHRLSTPPRTAAPPFPPRRRPGRAARSVLAAAACCACALPARAQQAYAQGPLLERIKAMRPGSWARVNANSFSDVWTPARLRPLKESSNPTPSKIIAAWSSFAWDSRRGDLILYGGGHANYTGNDVYRWRARTLDLDLILWSGGCWADAVLVIPHRAFRGRSFVLDPAARIARDWRDPITGLSLAHLHHRLGKRK